jgi:hypothetical protein
VQRSEVSAKEVLLPGIREAEDEAAAAQGLRIGKITITQQIRGTTSWTQPSKRG